MNVNPEEIKSWSAAAAAALSALKAAKDLLPTGKKKEEAAKAIEIAERDFQLAQAAAAKDFGFELCRRHWPPGIMVHSDGGFDICSDCGKPTALQSAQGVKTDAVKILKMIFDRGSLVDLDEIARHFNWVLGITRYHLDELSERALVRDVTGVGRYEISPAGREFIITNGMA